MRILLIGNFTYHMYAPAFEFGFKALGHDVRCVKYNDYLYGTGKAAIFFSGIQNRYHYGVHLFKYNSDILKTAVEFNPDFIFLYRCYNIWPSTVKSLNKKGFFIFTYNNDDPFSGVPSKSYYRYFLGSLKYANINYVYRKKNIEDYKNIGINSAKILLPYFIKKQNFCENITKDVPIAFIGHYENDGRDTYLFELKKTGLPITLFAGGQYWKDSPLYEELKEIIQPSASGLGYNHLINRIKVALVFFSKLNHDTYTRRCFEIPATKTLMLSEYTDDMNRMFPENECAVYFRSKEELVEKCKKLLVNPSEIDRIAENGYKRLMEIGGSEVDRCKEIINCYLENKQR